MRLDIRNSARIAIGAALLATVVLASTASAVALRSPQVVFQNASLQGYLNANDGGINTATDQLDAQNFAVNVSGNTDFTLMIELSGNAGLNNIGVYNAGDASPALYQLFPGTASAGYSVFCKFFASGVLYVDLYDALGNNLGRTTYAGVTRNQIGFYIQGPGGTYYSQDYRNAASNPQVLTYAGTDINIGDWWECFNDTPYAPNLSTFDSAVLLLQSVAPQPVPTEAKSWGALKATYR